MPDDVSGARVYQGRPLSGSPPVAPERGGRDPGRGHSPPVPAPGPAPAVVPPGEVPDLRRLHRGAVARRRRHARPPPDLHRPRDGHGGLGDRPATAADMPTSLSCPKLMVSGSSAEQPNPASPKAATPATGRALAAPRSPRTPRPARTAAGDRRAGSETSPGPGRPHTRPGSGHGCLPGGCSSGPSPGLAARITGRRRAGARWSPASARPPPPRRRSRRWPYTRPAPGPAGGPGSRGPSP
jgi:hypothetical protein